jgi:hypothetical protein
VQNPVRLLWFVQVDQFVSAWKKLSLIDEDLRALEFQIIGDPTGAPVVAGTGGVRKLRFAPPRWKRGSRGSLRVYYAYFDRYGLVLLVMVHSKNTAESISAGEKGTLKKLVGEVEGYLKRRADAGKRSRA